MKPTVLIWGHEGMYSRYAQAIEDAGGQALLSKEALDADALLLPGGGDLEPWRYREANTASRQLEPERDEAEFALLRRFTAMKKPVLGICKGMQSINVFFGGTLHQDLPGHGAAGGQDRFHRVRSAGFLLPICGDSCIVNSAHHQSVKTLGHQLEALQWAPDGTVEALCHAVLPVWGLQWHPERMPGSLGPLLFRHFMDHLKK